MKSTKNTESKELHLNALNTNKSNLNSELLENIEIEGKPFNAIRMEDKWFLAMGKYRLTEPMNSLEEVLEDAERSDWYRVMQIMNIVIKEHKK